MHPPSQRCGGYWGGHCGWCREGVKAGWWLRMEGIGEGGWVVGDKKGEYLHCISTVRVVEVASMEVWVEVGEG